MWYQLFLNLPLGQLNQMYSKQHDFIKIYRLYFYVIRLDIILMKGKC